MVEPNVFPFGAGATLDDLARRFGGQFDFRETLATIGVASGSLIGGNAERVSLTFSNFGAADVIASPGLNPTTTRGLRIGAAGGIITFDVMEDSLLPILAWQGISVGAGNVVYVLEVFRFTTSNPTRATL